MKCGILNLNCPGVVFFGHVPFGDEILAIKEMGVQVIWNLLDDLTSVQEEEKVFDEVIHSPISDYSIPDAESRFLENLETITDRLINGKTVFIHCLGGRGRTGMALGALLMKLNGVSAEETLDRVYDLCRGPETEEQKDFVRSLEKKNA